MALTAFSGPHASPADVDGGANVGVGLLASDDITTGVANALILGVMTPSGGTMIIDPGVDYTEIGENEDNVCCQAFSFAYRIISGAAALFTVDWSLEFSVTWAAQTRSFKPALVTATTKRKVIVIQ